MCRAFDVVAVPKRKPQTAAYPLLLPERGAERFQQSMQPSEQELVVHFVRIESERPFNHWLCGRWMNRRGIDAYRPVMQESGGRTEDGLQLRQRNRGDRAERAKVQILEPLNDDRRRRARKTRKQHGR